MSQPDWKLIYASDCEALHVDQTGVYPPELTIVQDLGESVEELDGRKFLIYRFPMDRCYYDDLDDILSDNRFHQYMRAWFASADRWGDKLSTLASYSGISRHDLIDLLCSDDPRKLAIAYGSIASYYGPDEFDHYSGNVYRTSEDVEAALS